MIRCTKASALTLALLLAAAHAEAGAADKPAPAPAWQKVQLGVAGASYPFPVYSNHALDGDTSKIRRVLIIQHGRARDGDAYFLAAENLMKNHGIDPAETLLLSPQFFTPAQTAKARLPDLPAWSGAGFAGGEDSVDPPFSVSSFQVYDDLLELLTDRRRFPGLRAENRKIKRLFSLSATIWLAQKAVKRAVFTENFPLSMTIRTLHWSESLYTDAV